MKQRSLMKRWRIYACALMLLTGLLILLRPSGAWAEIPEEPIDIVLVVDTIHAEDGSLYEGDSDYIEGNQEYRDIIIVKVADKLSSFLLGSLSGQYIVWDLFFFKFFNQ